MRGEFRGDFSRDTFDPEKHFSSVLKQQGRVQLDADWNEQVGILLHYLQTLAKDMMMVCDNGSFTESHGGPKCNLGFVITPIKNSDRIINLDIRKGHYYVDGILCENEEEDVTYKNQPDYTPNVEIEELENFLVYIDVWERHINYIQDEEIREVALNGPDTATRSKLVWQVKVWKVEELNCGISNYASKFNDRLTSLEAGRGRLKAQAKKEGEEVGPCKISPESRYRGVENQLYRVEIHNGGPALNDGYGGATFKWSRENGSVAFPIRKIDLGDGITTIELEHLGRDRRFSIDEGDLVEVIDDDYILRSQDRLDSPNETRSLLKVISVDIMSASVKLEGAPSYVVSDDREKHPLLRRWDHRHPDNVDDNCIRVVEEEWIALEDGIKIWFEEGNSYYQIGDYWLIPARTATGDVEWPKEMKNGEETPKALPPHGIDHHYAPLAAFEHEGSDNPVRERLQYYFDLNLQKKDDEPL